MYLANKADIVNLLETHRDEVIATLQSIYDTPDDNAYKVVSGSEDTGDAVYEEITAPNPRWRQLGFSTRAEIKDFIGSYPDDNLNSARAKQIADHQSHIVITKSAYDAKIARYTVQSAKLAAITDNLPSWATVSTAVDNIANLADAKAYLKKLSRVVYWLAKDKAD